MIREPAPDELAIVRDSLEAIERGLFTAFLSGKRLGIVEADPPTAGDGSGAQAPADAAPVATSAAPDHGGPGDGDAPAGARRLGVVLVDEAVLRLPLELRQGASGGLQVGVLEDGFALDLQGAIVMARETRRQAIRVNEKATRLFLYSRSILGTSILAYDHGLRPGDHCIVTNPRREALGIGRVVGSFKAPKTAVEAVHDLGSYLRDE